MIGPIASMDEQANFHRVQHHFCIDGLTEAKLGLTGATAGLSSSVVTRVMVLHCWTSQQWHTTCQFSMDET